MYSKRWNSAALVLLAFAFFRGHAFAAESGGSTKPEKATKIEQVVVTAMRRSQEVRNVPVSITALSGEDIIAKQVVAFNDIMTQVPGLRFSVGKGQHLSSIYIRGQAQANESVAMDTPVAYFQDDLYYGTTASYVADFYDTAQISVLKGPQGTTFGRNVDGGAVVVTSNVPEMGVDGAYINATIENYAGAEVWGYINHAFSDTLAARLSISSRNRDGYDKNVYTGNRLNDNHSLGARGQLRWQPRSDLDIQLSLSWYDVRNAGDATKYIGQGIWAAYQAQKTGNDPHKVYDGTDGYQKRDVGAAVLHINWNTSLGDVKSITGIHGMSSHYLEDVSDLIGQIYVNPFDINNELVVSQEFRLVSPSDQMFTYVAGLYGDYSDESFRQDQTWDSTVLVLGQPSFFSFIQANAGLPPMTTGQIIQTAQIRTFAPYFEGTWHITKDLGLTAGVRYTITNKHSNNIHTGPSFSYGVIPYQLYGLHHTWYQLTPRFIADYHIRDGLMVYASVSNGVKSGGWSFSAPTAALAQIGLRPEHNWAYEVGMKGTFFGGRLYIAADVYNQVTTDAQIKNLVNGFFIDANTQHITTNGVELQADFRPITGLDLGVQWAYTDSYYGQFKPCSSGGADCSGNQVIGVPLNDVMPYVSYDYQMANGGDLFFRADVRFTSSFSLDPTGKAHLPLAQPQTAITGLTNVGITYTPPSAPWTVQLWAKNLSDETYIANAANYFFFALTTTEFFSDHLREADRVAYGAPRTFGVTVDYRF